MVLKRLTATAEDANDPGVQRTTLSLDALGRFICNTWDEATSNPDDFDVVVIGAGMYGGYCAAKIFELSRQALPKPLRVLVLEAGPFLVPEHTQNLPSFGLFDPGGAEPVPSGSNPGTRNLVWGVGWRSNRPFVGQAYCVGGKGVFWGGWCPRLIDSDLEDWPAEVRAFLTTDTTIGERPITHDEDGVRRIQGQPIAGYETLEYEIGVKPSDDFVFDPLGAEAPNPKLVGLNRALRKLITEQENAILADARARLGADPGLELVSVDAAPIAVQTQSYTSGLFSLDKYSSLPALIAAVRDDHKDGRTDDLRIAVVPNAHVVRLLTEPHPEAPDVGTRLISGILVRHEGAERTLRLPSHCQVVLALGALESTRLALQSFSLQGSGLVRSRAEERMGRNLMIHLRADIRFSVERSRLASFVAANFALPDGGEAQALAQHLQLGSLHVQCDGPHGRFQYQLYAATNDRGPDAGMYRMIPDLDVMNAIQKGFNSSIVKVVLRGSAETVGGRAAPLGDPGFDFVDLAGDADFDHQFGHPRAWVEFRDHQNDPVWKDLHDMGHAIAKAIACGGEPVYDGDFQLPAMKVQQGYGTTFHDAGTLWMGDEPDLSVTDVNGHFHHVTNAYACDQSLFPTVGSANPVLTGLALSRKVAADIVGRHRSRELSPAETAGFQRVPLGQNWIQRPYAGMSLFDSIFETNPFDGIGIAYLDRVLSNFELKLEWKAFRGRSGSRELPNAGILLRMPDPAGFDLASAADRDQFYAQVLEVQIDDSGKNFAANRVPQAIFGDSRYKTGAIYGVAPARQWAAKVLAPEGSSSYWNVLHVRANFAEIRIVLNDKLVCEAQLPPGARMSGRLGLQFHTGKVQFRNVFLKEL